MVFFLLFLLITTYGLLYELTDRATLGPQVPSYVARQTGYTVQPPDGLAALSLY